ncbi:uncharacterized membrane protein YcaP (DUF421 family) [Scopulibacillus daqui]|uniref:Uncharacterized membrane protein YcaP (DUF421 family) n=1 Tax=Scopulibacillus daqui TaxID=1469162 RepID=A0ABS2Q2H7_9BACL|nr:DUF421 domain-containing protein [Scopulibacillus daqui]MBM7646050.1 uncharacterized membrane protein YcaP (DUF421 family) [Scopulibacillus daqui]
MNETLVVMVRGIIGFFTLLLLTRILGKQQISQLTFFDYILGITIGSIAASLTTDLTTRAFPHWIGLIVWVILGLLLQGITLKWRRGSKFLDGEPTIVIMNGRIMDKALKKMRYRVADLLEELREKGIFDLNEVEYAVLETNGKLSVLKKAANQPITPKDLNLSVPYKGISTELIYDGVVIDENIKAVNRDRAWLEAELKKRYINHPSQVFLALLDPNGQLFIDKYSDNQKNIIDIGDYPGPN